MPDDLPHPLADPGDLVGTWELERVIEDRWALQRHHLYGSLRIVPEGGELRWEESLVWHRHGSDVDLRRGLRLVRVQGAWWVRFEDGRDFHTWAPGEQVVHSCAPDTYAGRVTGTPRRWTVTWVVSGPAKDYTMASTLTPSS